MASKKKAQLYFIVYPFMQRDLGLSGITRDVFAIIFGFWRREKIPVYVPYSTIREMTGATDPSISAAINRLKKEELIAFDRHERGLKSRYRVTLPPEVLAEFESDYIRAENFRKNENDTQSRQAVPPSSSYDISENTIK